jgi:hypothetical protein
MRHGVDCSKVRHIVGRCYDHPNDDDSAYDVDGVTYCGRCHSWLEIPPPAPRPTPDAPTPLTCSPKEGESQSQESREKLFFIDGSGNSTLTRLDAELKFNRGKKSYDSVTDSSLTYGDLRRISTFIQEEINAAQPHQPQQTVRQPAEAQQEQARQRVLAAQLQAYQRGAASQPAEAQDSDRDLAHQFLRGRKIENSEGWHTDLAEAFGTVRREAQQAMAEKVASYLETCPPQSRSQRVAAVRSLTGAVPRPEGCICSEAYGVGPEQCGKHGAVPYHHKWPTVRNKAEAAATVQPLPIEVDDSIPVNEIHMRDSAGTVHKIINVQPPQVTASNQPTLAEALEQLRQDHIFIEQQRQRMAELEAMLAQPPQDKALQRFDKAFDDAGTCDRCHKAKKTVGVLTGFAGEREYLCGDCVSEEYAQLEEKLEASQPVREDKALRELVEKVPHRWYDKLGTRHYAHLLVTDQPWTHDEQCVRCQFESLLPREGGIK